MKFKPSFLNKKHLILGALCLAGSVFTTTAQIRNFDNKGRQVIRFTEAGNAVDAHDGEIAYFNGIYYLYGTSYDCGFEWGNKGAPFCGFKVYTSKDMVSWTDKGALFDATSPVWQTRCDGKTYGCFRPHVIYNAKTKQYVLWINVYDNVIGYRVFTSKRPVGPFVEQKEPHLAVNNDKPAAGLNNGDHDTFVDTDGTAYLAYTDWRTKGTIVIEKLTDDYLSGTGEYVKAVTAGQTEAPGMFKRNGIYYVVYSDPNCGYCSGTGSSYKTAKKPLGPWSEGKKISDNSCGGQPSFVSTIKFGNDNIYLYGSDLWNNAAKNEALANYYWAPLSFEGDGSIKPLDCPQVYSHPKLIKAKAAMASAQAEGNQLGCDIAKDKQFAQAFIAGKSGTLSAVSVTLFKNHRPDHDLTVSIYTADNKGAPAGKPLYEASVAQEKIGWSAKSVSLKPNCKVEKGKRYAIVLKTEAATGCFGVVLHNQKNGGSISIVSTDGGAKFTTANNTISLKFKTVISSK